METPLQLAIIGVSNGAVVALNALGFTLVYGIVRRINFAHGDVFALCTVLVGYLVVALGFTEGPALVPPVIALPLVLIAAMAFGAGLNFAVERLAFRPFRDRSALAPLLASVALSLVFYQAAILWRGNPPPPRPHHGEVDIPLLRVPDLFPNPDLARLAGLGIGLSYTLKDLLPLLMAIGLAAGVSWLLGATRLGRAMRAASQDPELAELCGVDRGRATMAAFALGGALAGTAGVVFAFYHNSVFTQHGALSGLAAFTAAVLGGIGNPKGAVVSGLLFGVVSAFSDYFLVPQLTPALLLGLLVLLLTLRPAGLAGDGDGREGAPPDALVAISGGGHGTRSPRVRAPGLGLLAAVALGYPFLDGALGLGFQVSLAAILLYALMALGLNVVVGFAGLLDLGFVAFFALGGYVTAFLTVPSGPVGTLLPPALRESGVALPASVAVVAAFGVVLGVPTLRTRGEYLAIVTLAFGEIVPAVLRAGGAATGGPGGLSVVPGPRLFGLELSQPSAWYYLALSFAAFGFLASRRLRDSRLSRAWAAVREDDLAAASCGVDPPRARLLAFAVGAACAGLAGSIYASMVGHVEPGQFDFTISMMVLAMVILGGPGNVAGAVLGALAIGFYNYAGVALASDMVQAVGARLGVAPLAHLDLRSLNLLAFGGALYLTLLLRTRAFARRGRFGGLPPAAKHARTSRGEP